MSRLTFNSYLPAGGLSVKPDTREIFQKIMFRSTAYAISAYFIVLLAERLLILGGSLLRGFSVILKYDSIKVLAPASNWDQETVLLIYMIPFFLLILSFIWLNIKFMRLEFTTKFSKLFILWMMFFIIYRVAGMFPSHLFFKTGIDYIFSWLYFGVAIKILAGVFASLIFLLTGNKILKGILAISGNYQPNIRFLRMQHLILSSVFLPIIIVMAFAMLFNLPALPREELSGLGLLAALGIYFFIKMSSLNPKHFDINEDIRVQGNPKLLFFLVIGIVVILRLLLESGIVIR